MRIIDLHFSDGSNLEVDYESILTLNTGEKVRVERLKKGDTTINGKVLVAINELVNGGEKEREIVNGVYGGSVSIDNGFITVTWLSVECGYFHWLVINNQGKLTKGLAKNAPELAKSIREARK